MPTYNIAPSVIVQENDRSEYGVEASTNNSGAFIGNFSWGPIGYPQTINLVKKLETYFGKPKKFNTQDFHTAKQYLETSGNLLVSRYNSIDLSNAHNDVSLKDLAINEYISDPFIINSSSSNSLQAAKQNAISIINSLSSTDTYLTNIYISAVNEQSLESNVNKIIEQIRIQDGKRNRTIIEIQNLIYNGIYPNDTTVIQSVKSKYKNYIKMLETSVANVYKYYLADIVIDFDRQLAIKNNLEIEGINSYIGQNILDYFKNQFETALQKEVIKQNETFLNKTLQTKTRYIDLINELKEKGLSESRATTYVHYINQCGPDAESYIFQLASTEVNTNVEQTPDDQKLNKIYWEKRNNPIPLDARLYSDYNIVTQNLINKSEQLKIKINNEYDFQIKTDIPLSIYFTAKYPGSLANGIIVSIADNSTYDSWEYAKYFRGAPNTSTYVANQGGSNDEVHVIVIDKAGNFGIKGGILEMYSYLSKAIDGKNEDGLPSYYINYINNNSKYIYITNPFVSSDYETIPFPRPLSETSVQNVFTRALHFFNGEEINGVHLTISDTLQPEQLELCQYYIDEMEGRHGITALNLFYKLHETPVSKVPENIHLKDLYESISEMIYKIRNLNKSYISHDLFIALKTLDFNFLLNDIDYMQLQLQQIANQYDIELKKYHEKVNFGIGLESKNTHFGLFINSLDFDETHHTFELKNGTDAQNITDGEKIASWRIFEDSNKYDPFVVVAGSVSSTVANNISAIFMNRADAIVWTSPCDVIGGVPIIGEDEIAKEKILKYRKGLTSSNYVNMDSAYAYIVDSYHDGFVWIPCCANNAANYARGEPWLSPSGWRRGIHPGVIKLSTNPDTNLIAELYRYGINSMITDNKGTTLLFGDKNLQEKDSQLNRIPVRGTLILIEKDIANAAKYSLFENNNIYTQSAFINRVKPYLQKLKGEGLEDFDVICDDTNNTPEVKLSHEFVGDIYLKFESSINWVKVNFNILAKMTQVSESITQYNK